MNPDNSSTNPHNLRSTSNAPVRPTSNAQLTQLTQNLAPVPEAIEIPTAPPLALARVLAPDLEAAADQAALLMQVPAQIDAQAPHAAYLNLQDMVLRQHQINNPHNQPAMQNLELTLLNKNVALE